jgi:hypothetical protein
VKKIYKVGVTGDVFLPIDQGFAIWQGFVDNLAA